MIRLIATDVDGTLVDEGSPNIDPGYAEVIRALSNMGICVAVATGRHIDSTVRLFEPVKELLWYICDNGAITGQLGKELKEERIPAELYRELLRGYSRLEGCELLVTTGKEAFIPVDSSKEFEELLTMQYRFDVKREKDLADVQGVIKFSIYHENEIRRKTESMIDSFAGRLYGVVAGTRWVDFMMPSVGKDKALASLMKELRVSPEECVAFGDQMNDLGMITMAGHGYAVSTAVPACIEAAEGTVPPWNEAGVLQMLRKILIQKGEI